MEDKNFTVNDARTINEMLETLRIQELEIQNYDKKNLTEEQEKEMQDYFTGQDFLSEMRVSLDFIRNSTSYKYDKGDCILASLLPAKEDKNAPDGFAPEIYSHALMTLTNGFDVELEEMMYSKGHKVNNESYANQTLYDAFTYAPLVDYNISRSLELDKKTLPERTVGDICEVIEYTSNQMKELNIPYDDVINKTSQALINAVVDNEAYIYDTITAETQQNTISLARFKDLEERGYTQYMHELPLTFENEFYEDGLFIKETPEEEIKGYEIFLQKAEELEGKSDEAIIKAAKEEIEKEKIPVVIVESIDGYVMSATKITPENEKEFDEKVQKGNEVIHNEVPTHTTIDMSEVGGNVKYEQNDDIGTVEKAQGVLTYEEKEDRQDQKKTQETARKHSQDDYDRD